MPTLPNMSLITPTPGGDSGTWDDKINAAFVLVDAHDHTSGKGVQIVSAAININADLAWGGFGITALGKLTFSAIAEPDSGSLNLFVSTDDNELYWRSSGGTNVKLTSGATINTSLVGGIAGDYSTVGAEVAFNDADQVYTFKDQSTPTKKWARLASGPVRIYENDSTESVYVEHAVDSTLASSYTVTWPAALPASQTLVQVTAAGAITCSNTLPADTDITLSGTGEVKHGERTITMPFGPYATWITGTLSVVNNWAGAGTGVAWRASAGGFGAIHLPLQVGWRVKKVKIVGSGGTVIIGLGVQQYDGDAGATATYTTVGPTYVATLDGDGWLVGSSSSFDTNTDTDVMRLEISPNDQTDFTSISIVYDIP